VTILLWSIVIALFVISMIGLLFPIIPSVLAIWGGFLLYHFTLADVGLSIVFWVSMIVLTIILFVADYVSNLYFVKKYGGSKAAGWAGAIGLILGSFIFPPFGLIIVPFVLIVLVEVLRKTTFNLALKVALGSAIGFLGSTVAKFFIQLMMIIWFFIAIW
jgi:uncharacterized protein YqgC (DUF456 family)